jgi:hypothetical protein
MSEVCGVAAKTFKTGTADAASMASRKQLYWMVKMADTLLRKGPLGTSAGERLLVTRVES